MAVDLTKWPRLIVEGENVTPEQANEILVRTNDWSYFSSNDKGWERAIRTMVGAPPDYHESLNSGLKGPEIHDQWKVFTKKMRMIDLTYLHNHRIMSSWIGGPHGWCDWDGTIGTSEYNIGKWPSEEDVTEDWLEIASSFPYLKLTARLVPDEGESLVSVVRFEIADGGVTTIEEREPVFQEPEKLSIERMLATIQGRGGERGVTLTRLGEALRQVWEG
jgi:hypothetical protein